MSSKYPTHWEGQWKSPPDRTHWEDCWKDQSHHGCALVKIEELQAENVRLQAALSEGAELLDEVQNGSKSWSAIAEFVEKYGIQEETDDDEA